MGMIFQEPMTSLNPVYTVGEQIAEVFHLHEQLPKTIGLQKAVETLSQVGIPSPKQRIHEYPHQLSGGMRQRIMIAMAMACQPKLLIADEPTTALDVTIQAQILDLMLELQEQIGMSIMMITHDLGVVAEMSDQVAVMYAGKVVEQARVDAIFNAPSHPYTRGLMRSIPRPGRKFKDGKQALAEIPGMVPGLIDPPPGCLFAPRCEEAFERCRQAMPPLFELGNQPDRSHGVRCWLAESMAQQPATQGGRS
jgi:oligopeptide/dipeptide ABC transporter ATP-binding protein